MSIDKSWFPLLDQIVTSSISKKQRIIGITSLHSSSGVSLFCENLAKSFSLSQNAPLLIDLAGDNKTYAENDAGNWLPQLERDLSPFVKEDARGYDRVRSHPDRENRFVYNNKSSIREILTDQLKPHDMTDQKKFYDRIILDLPALFSTHDENVNPVSCAAACDAIYLICMTGKVTSPDLAKAKDDLAHAGVPLTGILLNDRDYVSTGESMAQFMLKFRAFIPGARRLASKLSKSEFLK